MKSIIDQIPLNQPLISIVEHQDTEFETDELCLDRLDLIFPNYQLTILPVTETDEIEISIQPNRGEDNTVNLVLREALRAATRNWWEPLLHQTLQMLWLCQNQQGYTDQLIFAFETLQPTLGILAEGSVLKPFYMRSISRQITQIPSRLEAIV